MHKTSQLNSEKQIQIEYTVFNEIPALNRGTQIDRTKKNIREMRPMVKWVGGKTQQLDSLIALVPKSFNSYHEPFFGGGALFYKMKPKKGTINDLNSELMTTYRILKDNYIALIEGLEEMVVRHNDSIDSQAFYYLIRDQRPAELSDLEIAIRFIYLNKTCFNGLYRVNKANKFNSPFNNKETIKNTTIFSKENIENISKLLNKNKVKIMNKDFDYILEEAEKNDFVFIDSPYDQSWTGYQSGGFNEEEHIRLANVAKELHRRGVKFMLTNHDTPLIRELYADFNFYEIPVNRTINSKSKNRKNATTEVIIINYDITEEQKRDFNSSKFLKQLQTAPLVLNELVKTNGSKDKQQLSTKDKNALSDKWFSDKISNILKENKIEFKREVSYDSILNTIIYEDKNFDFVFKIEDKTYCIETDLFNSPRVRINSECDRLAGLNEVFSHYPDLEFIWITDGLGLRNYKSKVTQTLKKIEKMFNLTLFEEFIR